MSNIIELNAAAKSPLIVAVDDGYAQTKLWGENLDKSGITSFIMRSSARPGRYGLMSLAGEGISGSYRTEEDQEFTVSEEIEGEDTQFDAFHVSPMNRVLVNHALSRAGYANRPVHLISALPVGNFFSDGSKRNESAIEAKKANLMKKIKITTDDGGLANIVRVDIGCQAMAAFVDYWLDDDMKERDVPVERVAVVDIGGRTTDVILVLDGVRFDQRKSGTENIGVLDVYNSLAAMIRAKFETRDHYPLTMLDTAVRSGYVRLWGERHDVTEMVKRAVIEQREKLSREIQRRLGDGSDLDAILFVGGGASLFKEITGSYRNSKILENPEWSNARGLYKYLKYFSNDTQKTSANIVNE